MKIFINEKWGAGVMFVDLLNIFSWARNSISPAPWQDRLCDKKSRKFNKLRALGHHRGLCQNKQSLAQGCKVLSQGKHCPLPNRELFLQRQCVGERRAVPPNPLTTHPTLALTSVLTNTASRGLGWGEWRGHSYDQQRKI